MTDAELIHQCLNNDRNAWDEFAQRFLPIIYGTIKNTSKDRFEKFGKQLSRDEYEEIVMELAHDVFVSLMADHCKALRKFEGRGGCPLGGYIGTIANRKALDYWRKIKDTESLDEEVAIGEGKPIKKQDMLSGEHDQLKNLLAKDTVSMLLENLDAQDRKLCELLFLQGMEAKDVAHEIGISVGHFYVRKQRVIQKLKESASKKEFC